MTSPATTTRPVVSIVSTATRQVGVRRLEQVVQHRVADRVGDLVGVTLGHGLGGEQTSGHFVFSCAIAGQHGRWCGAGSRLTEPNRRVQQPDGVSQSRVSEGSWRSRPAPGPR